VAGAFGVITTALLLGGIGAVAALILAILVRETRSVPIPTTTPGD